MTFKFRERPFMIDRVVVIKGKTYLGRGGGGGGRGRERGYIGLVKAIGKLLV